MNRHGMLAVVAVLAGLSATVCGEVKPLVRVGFKAGQTSVKINGPIKQGADGTFTLPGGGQWGWISVASGKPMKTLEGLQSFTICGWARPTGLQTGRGGNRIAFNLNVNRSGFDLVHHNSGGFRLAVNEWPDNIHNDSSKGKLQVGKWIFFAVAYDSTKKKDNVRWYFGGPKAPAALDKATSYNNGPTDKGSGSLTIGNYNETLQSHGTDRQFRGQLHAVQIFGSKTDANGALGIEAIRGLQTAAAPDFKAAVPATPVRTSPTEEAVASLRAVTPPPGKLPRIIATTDGEIDDRCSMIRFLLYANEWDIEGIIHCSSKFHWKGDGKNIRRHGWADEVWLDKQIDHYEQIYPKLSQHAKGFPTAAALRKLVYTGNVENVGDMSKDTPGSDRIVEILLDNEPGPVYLQAWGGTNTIARALWKIQHKHPGQVEKVSKKAIIFIILDQDRTLRSYIAPNWPKVQVLGSFAQFNAMAYSWARIIPQPQKSYFEKDWMNKNILKNHGPLCKPYEAHRGGAFRSEGDSPAFMHQIVVGLRSLEHPGYGGWGGRFRQEWAGSAIWRGARDDSNRYKSIWRWSIAFQNDWAARADWCVKDFKDANHPPKVKVAGSLDRTAKPGEKITLSAAGSSDPDGNKLSYRWWRYDDVDTANKKIEITGADKQDASFVVPDEPGKTIHIILDVTDNGDPPLTRYARMIVKIAG